MARKPKGTNTVCVTGGDEKFFLHILALIGSFRIFCPQRQLIVCDFGLSENQIKFLQPHARVIPMPAELRDAPHPWHRKASLATYLRDVPFDSMIWIDSDCLIVGDAPAELIAAAKDSRAKVVACPSGWTMGEFICDQYEMPTPNVRHFVEMLSQHHLGLYKDYLNSGVFLCTSREMLENWQTIALAVPMHVLFEQNAFNVAAYQAGPPLLVDAKIYNVNDRNLAPLHLPEGNAISVMQVERIANDEGRDVRVIHFTSHTDLVTTYDMSIGVGDRHLNGTLRRVPDNICLYALQVRCLSWLLAEEAKLLACGLLDAEPRKRRS